MTHTNDKTNPPTTADLSPEVYEALQSMGASSTSSGVDHGRRLYLLGRIEQVLRTGDPEAPAEFDDNLQTTTLDRLAYFFGQFPEPQRRFSGLSYGDHELVEAWLLFRCGLPGDPQVTIPQRVADLTRDGQA